MKISITVDYLFLIWISLPAIYFVIDPETRSYADVMLITYFINILICCSKPRYILPSYFMYLLISPLWYNWLGLHFILINVVPLFFILLYIITRKEVYISRNLAIILWLLLTICFFSVAFSPYKQYLIFGIINFINVIIIIVIAYDYVKKEPDFEIFEKFIMCAGVVITSMMIVSFTKINLSDFLMFSAGVIEEAEEITLFPKATYFYNNVFYVIGASILISYSNVLLKKRKFPFVVLFLYTFCGLIILFNKTAFLALFFALVYTTYTCRKYISSKILISIVFLVGSLTLMLIFFIIANERVSDMIHLESLKARLSIFDNIILAYANDPLKIFTGTGPGSLLRVPVSASDFILLVKTSAYNVEGTLDSGLMSYLIEYGIFFIVIFVLFMMITILLGLKSIPKNPQPDTIASIYRYGGAYFLYVFLCCLTQVLSIGKISYLVFFLLASVFFGFFKEMRNTNKTS